MLTVDKCCCGCSLRTGSIMIAIFYLVKNGIATILFPFLITDRIDTGLRIVLTIVTVMHGVQFLTNFMLLVAVLSDKRVLFIPWIIIHIIMSTWTLISHFVASIVYLIMQSRVILGVTSILLMVLLLGIHAYFLIVVYSLYCEVKDQ